jgi:hypothetical protein
LWYESDASTSGASVRIQPSDFSPADVDTPSGGLYKARQAIQEGGFPGTVVAVQRSNGMGMHI